MIMKKLIYASLILIFSLGTILSCSEDNSSEIDIDNPIVGEWIREHDHGNETSKFGGVSYEYNYRSEKTIKFSMSGAYESDYISHYTFTSENDAKDFLNKIDGGSLLSAYSAKLNGKTVTTYNESYSGKYSYNAAKGEVEIIFKDNYYMSSKEYQHTNIVEFNSDYSSITLYDKAYPKEERRTYIRKK